ncbi:hypothetical protein [Cryptosporangium phraense]|uniref:DUF308 domain-containing protein n=1 Tax=Cryptosporangium phraense TaxID=2593070 RepID=A0A545AWT4_9ACTN|nr:hypothetical protein [Cryptosporangium phraense]TQS45055.1 hypothetical protein FL583_11185 [Cryptosporangium phraense]
MTTAALPATSGIAPTLRRLYFLRAGFAVVWAALLAATGSDLGPVSITLLVLYPLVDVAAAVVDFRSSGARGLYVNIAISALAALGLAIASASDIPTVLRVWGVWAIVAGLIQLYIGVTRFRLGGQIPMILSGGISVLAGSSFALMASSGDPALTGIAGYAVAGAIFFLISAIRLGRAAKKA